MLACRNDAGRLFHRSRNRENSYRAVESSLRDSEGTGVRRGEAGGVRTEQSAGSRLPGTTGFDRAATCRRRWQFIDDSLLKVK